MPDPFAFVVVGVKATSEKKSLLVVKPEGQPNGKAIKEMIDDIIYHITQCQPPIPLNEFLEGHTLEIEDPPIWLQAAILNAVNEEVGFCDVVRISSEDAYPQKLTDYLLGKIPGEEGSEKILIGTQIVYRDEGEGIVSETEFDTCDIVEAMNLFLEYAEEDGIALKNLRIVEIRNDPVEE